MLPCPHCRSRMTRAPERKGGYWGCNACGGRAVPVGRLKKEVPRAFGEALWDATARPGPAGVRRCPLCALSLRGVAVEHGGTHALDWCEPCSLVWFDRGEHEEAAGGPGAAVPPPPEPSAPGVQVSFDRTREFLEAKPAFESSHDILQGGWQDIPAILGLPVETNEETWHRPWTTWGVAAAVLAASVAAFAAGLDDVVKEWGHVPALPFRHGGLDWITSFFLHGGIWHLAGNLYFLLVFGDNVEDVLRPGKYLLLLLASTVLGDLLYALLEWGSTVPSIGASGGISGVLAYYALAFPHARLRVVRFFAMLPVAFTFSAKLAFWIWIGLQVLGAALQLGGVSDVNSLAHLGGAGMGVLWWRLGRE